MSKKKNKDDLISKDTELETAFEEDEMQTEESLESETVTLKLKIAELECTVTELKDKYLRSMAEFENYRRRTNEEKSDWIKRSTEKLALGICDVLDNFERALMQLTDEQKEDSFIKGILMIQQQLGSILEKEGVKRIEALGKDFDPNFHEALAHIASDMEEGKITAIIQNGYTMHDKLIRPVRVVVSSGLKTEIEEKE